MIETTGKPRGAWRAHHLLSAVLGAALAFPSLAAVDGLRPSPSAAVTGTASPAWPGPWNRTEVQRLIVTEAVGHGKVPAPLALAVADVESDFVSRTVASSGAVGVMQLHPTVAKNEFGADVAALRDPATNVRLGLRWLARLHERYDGDWELALSHFRGGQLAQADGRYRAHEYTRTYVHRVMQCWRRYQRDPLVQAWIRQANGVPRFASGETGPRLGAWTVRGPDLQPWRHAHGSHPLLYRVHVRQAGHRCDDTPAPYWPTWRRFNGEGGWTAVEGVPAVRDWHGGPWQAITGARGGRFQ